MLPVAIDSCLNQTYQNIEIIVVNDGSPDDVEGAIKIYEDRVTLISQKNKGLSSARNAGISVAKGEFIKFLDADDWLLPDCIEKQVHILSGLDRYIAISGYRLFFDNNKRKDEDIYPNIGRLKYELCYMNTGPPHTFLYYTKSIKEVNGFCTTNRVDGGHEDYDIVCRLAAKGYEAVVLHTIGCVYRQTANSMSQKMDKMRESRKKVWEAYTKSLLAADCSLEILNHILGGFALRLGTSDIRYEMDYLLKNTVEILLKKHAEEFSLLVSISILYNVSEIIASLPFPENSIEKRKRIKILQILKKVVLKIYCIVNDHFVIKKKPIMILCKTAATAIVNIDIKCGFSILIHAFRIQRSKNNIYMMFGFYMVVAISKKIYNFVKK